MANRDTMYGRMLSNAENRFADFDQQTQRYQRGEIGLADQMLQGAANSVGLFADVPAEMIMTAASNMTPDFVKRYMTEAGRAAMDTETAQAAMEWLNKNPQIARRMGYGLDLTAAIPGAAAASSAAKTGAKTTMGSLGRQMPNRQASFFYGSGLGGPLGSLAVTGPKGGVAALEEYINPFANAAVREGVPRSLRRAARDITPERAADVQQARTTIANASNRIKAARDAGKQPDPKDIKAVNDARNLISEYNTDTSYLVGQLDQEAFLQRQAGNQPAGPVGAYDRMQNLVSGEVDPSLISEAASLSGSLKGAGIELTDAQAANISNRIRRNQKLGDEKAIGVVRNTDAIENLSLESMGGSGNRDASRYWTAKNAIREYFPDKANFTDDELLEFAAIRHLPDDTLINKRTGQELNRYQRYLNRAIQPTGYVPKSRNTALSDIKNYYKYKAMDLAGEKLTTTQRNLYNRYLSRMDRAKADYTIEDGAVFGSGSHASAAKGLGGVNDVYMFKNDGSFVHFINDENDLLGRVPPGYDRLVSVTVPQGYNVFRQTQSIPNETVANAKRRMQQELADLGAPAVGANKQSMRMQLANSINNARPQLQASDFRKPAATAGLLTGIGALGSVRQEQ